MGFHFRKTKKIGPFRFTLSKRGLTGSVGGGGLRYQFLGGRRRKGRKPAVGYAPRGDSPTLAQPSTQTHTFTKLAALAIVVGALAFVVGQFNNSPKQTTSTFKAQYERFPTQGLLSPVSQSNEPRSLDPSEPESAYRVWKTSDGKYSTLARFLDQSDDAVRLLRRDPWQGISVPVARLSDADRTYLASVPGTLITGNVISIADGDTLTVRSGDENHRIRLVGIDAPEESQAFAGRAKQALSEKAFGRDVRIRWVEEDRYHRLLGDVLVDGDWINLQLVHEGWAWHYTDYSSDEDLAKAELEAREAKRGLWADANAPLAPWEFRSQRAELLRQKAAERDAVQSKPKASNTAEKPASLRHWLNTSSSVRHNASCRHYKNTKQGRMCGPNDGKPCGICGG